MATLEELINRMYDMVQDVSLLAILRTASVRTQ